MNLLNNDAIPVGLSMALAENIHAMDHFSKLNKDEQEAFVARAKTVRSKREMQRLVSDLNSMN